MTAWSPTWRRESLRGGVALAPVSVNVSLRDLRDVDIATEVARRCNKAGVPHDLIRVEFTESAASGDPETLKAQVRSLREQGFQVWMDDFGSGLSSLNTLKEFDFDLIKLDMGFLRGGGAEKRRVILDGVIRAAKRIGVQTLAEGVETAELAEELAGLGCDMLQGYHYFTPSPLEETYEAFMKHGKPLEPLGERKYWDAVGAVSLTDLANDPVGLAEEAGASALPAAVVELRDSTWRLLRQNDALVSLLAERGVIRSRHMPWHEETVLELDPAFGAAVARCDGSGEWELVAGPLEYGSGYQFRVRPLATCGDASAYLVASVPTPLGAALGTYGDVPVGYAVLCAEYGEGGAIADARIVYANGLYRNWGNLCDAPTIGAMLLDVSGDEEGPFWLSLCRRAIAGESVHDVSYSSNAGHWLSYSITPSLAEGHCIFAFTLADAEQEERRELIEAGTHDQLTGLLNRRGIDEAIERQIGERPGQPFVMVLLDVDDFKTVNDLYGHDVGDEALRLLARTLGEVFPSSAIVGRNGGDEALVALFGEAAPRVETYLTELMGIEMRCELHGRSYPLSLSAGYAWCDGRDLKAAYTRADQALYAAKLAGKSVWRPWTPEVDENPQRSLLGFTSRDLAEGMPLAMLAHRPNGEILFANEGLARLLGYDVLGDALEAAGRSLRGIVAPRDWSLVEDGERRGASGDEFETELHVLGRGGGELAVTYRARRVSSSERGEVVYAYIVGARAGIARMSQGGGD